MNPAVKKLWIEALRSEKYKKGEGKLRNGNNECCVLGVLCDISMVTPRWSQRHQEWLYNGYGGLVCDSILKWAGLPTGSHPKLLFAGQIRSLSDINDHTDITFNQFADLIEEQL